MAARLESWGRRIASGAEILSEDLERITRGRALSRGLGRSYGDASLPAPGTSEVVGTVLADRVLSFDADTGLLCAEAGLSLREIVRVFLPRGFFVPVTPGTMFVTLGGMVASDVHGKNHHRDGCFGAHVTRLRLRTADDRVLSCSRQEHPELFRATLGGMGLTGHVLEVEFRMVRVPSAWIVCDSERIDDIEAFIAGLKDAGRTWPMTMGWIDCLAGGAHMGRGILLRGRWAERDEAPGYAPRPIPRLTVPFLFPEWVLNRFSIRIFNEVYYRAHLWRHRRRIMHPEPFFYPLDMILRWNRIYGRRGFTQYQCVLPEQGGSARRFLERLTALGGASFLCVIKDCGAEGEGLLSFPKPGISIALDMAVRDDTQRIVDALNDEVISLGGRIYLTKDSFTRPEHFRAMEPRLPEFQRVRRIWDPEGRLKSALAVRVLGDRP